MLTRREFLKLTSGLAAAAHTPFLWSAWPSAPETTLEFLFVPHVDLYCFLRKEIVGYSRLGAPWQEALASMRKANGALPPRVSFAFLDGYIADAKDLHELWRSLFSAPEKGPADVPIAQPLGDVYNALRVSMKQYEKELLEQHKKAVQTAREKIDKELTPKLPEAIGFILDKLLLKDSGASVPIFLAESAPPPGGFTSRSRLYSAACFVGISGFGDSLLYEVILHESTHAFEVLATKAGDTVMDLLRRELGKRGVQSSDALYRDVPHTLMFVQSAETVKRIINHDHVPYGVSNGYYAKLPKVSAAVQERWLDHLDKGVDLDQTIRLMVDDVLSK